MKSVLVAGGAGFIGSHLCEALLQKGYRVTALDSLVTGRSENIVAARERGLQLVEADITKPLQQLERFDQIYNLASPASPVDFSRMPTFIMQTASVGHRQLLDLARASQARILFASTSEVYGDPLVHPQREDYFGNVNPIGDRSCYDEAKRYGEALTYAFRREFKVDVRVARIFNTYGPRMRPDDGRIIPNFFVQALQGENISIYGDGSQTRSFCYVNDLVDGLISLMESDETLPVNIGNPDEYRVRDIAENIVRLTRSASRLEMLPLPENDPKQRRPDIEKAKRVLSWQATTSLESGLNICLNYFTQELKRRERIVVPVIK